MAEKPLSDNPAVAAQLRQLLAERENAVAYEQETRVAAVDKQLTELGYTGDAVKVSEGPQGRQSAPQETAEGGAPAKSAAKSEWVEYAVSHGVSREEAEAATKDDLVATYGD